LNFVRTPIPIPIPIPIATYTCTLLVLHRHDYMVGLVIYYVQYQYKSIVDKENTKQHRKHHFKLVHTTKINSRL